MSSRSHCKAAAEAEQLVDYHKEEDYYKGEKSTETGMKVNNRRWQKKKIKEDCRDLEEEERFSAGRASL